MVLSYSKAARYSAESDIPTSEGGAQKAEAPKVFSKQAATGSAGAPVSTPDAALSHAQPEETSASSSSIPAASPVATSSSSTIPNGNDKPLINHLILDAGPLLSLTPLRHLAQRLYTTPAVLKELRDPKAREYLQRIREGVEGWELEVVQPGAESMARVIAFAKKTGDYAVLSSTDLGVIALTLQCEIKENGTGGVRLEPGQKLGAVQGQAGQGGQGVAGPSGSGSGSGSGTGTGTGTGSGAEVVDESTGGEAKVAEEENVQDEEEEAEIDDEEEEAGAEEASDAEAESSIAPPIPSSEPESTTAEPPTEQLNDLSISPTPLNDSTAASPSTQIPTPIETAADDGEDSESDAGEWITPSTLSTHRSRDLGHLPEGGRDNTKALAAACMTGDFAVQNVLLAMGLGVVGEGGKRIGKVKSWVLRCHACFKTCKDPSKKFCPSCGNPTLLRTSTTTTSNGKTHLHLKKNYQYNLRGSKFTIPDAKPGRAKGQLKGGTGLILREDQREWMDAVKMEEGRKGKEEKKMLKGWDDPDWMPEIITVGMSGKGRMGAHGLPNIGHGRKNPNIAKKKR